MALEKSIVPITFRGGVDTKTDSKQVVLNKLATLENGVFTAPGQIQKRNGYTAMPTTIFGGGNITSAQAIAAFKNELLQFAGNTLYSWSPNSSAWVSRGSIYPLSVGVSSLVKGASSLLNPDSVTLNGVTLYAWQDSGGAIYASVADAQSGTLYQNQTLISNAGTQRPKCVAVGSNIVTLIAFTGGSQFSAKILNTASPGVFTQPYPTTVLTANDLNATNQAFDAVTLGSNAIIAYYTSSNNIKVGYLKSDGTIGSLAGGLYDPITISDTCTSLSLAIDSGAQNIYLSYVNASGDLKYTVLSYSLTTVKALTTILAGSTAIRTTMVTVSTNNVALFYDQSGSAVYNYKVAQNTLTPTGVTGGGVIRYGVTLASQAYVVNGEAFVNCTNDSPIQATYFVLNSTGKIVAKMQYGNASGFQTDPVLPKVTQLSSTQVKFPILVVSYLENGSFGTTRIMGLSLATLEHSPSVQFNSLTLGDDLHICGGYLSMYDGAAVVEHGFHLFPEHITYTTSAGGVDAGTHQYFFVYAWVDAQGKTHRSAPSIAVTVTLGSASQVAFTIPTLQLTDKTNSIIEIYRTAANGTVAHLITSPTQPIVNTPGLPTVTYNDGATDASIASNQILYTTGGIIENIAAPACQSVAGFKKRLMLSGLESNLDFWYSKTNLESEPVQFTDQFLTQMDPTGGATVATQYMDEKLIIFKQSAIFVQGGDGPLDTGQQSTFSDPALLPTSVGCSDPRSVVLTPDGIIFKSAQGIYLLDRGLSTHYIGAAVEAYNSQTLVSAKLVPGTTQVRFLTNSGSTLTYDYYLKDESGVGQWGVYTNHTGVDATIWNGAYVYLQSSGVVMQETASHFTDGASTAISLKVGTPWIKTGDLQAFMRVYRALFLADYRSAHVLTIKIGYDYDPSWAETITFTPDGSIPEQLRVHLQKQKCEAIRFQISDSFTGSAGEGYALSGISLEIGMKRGLKKLSAANSTG